MTLLGNLLRVVLCGLWTVVVGLPLVAVLQARQVYARLQARSGDGEATDRALEANARLTCWVAQRLWSGMLLAFAGIRVHARAVAPADWSREYVICANHASVFDILALVRLLPPPYRFVAKRELLRWPIIGWALRPAGQIVIDRSRHAEALQSIAEAAARKVHGHVVFFVEGTRSRSGELQPFKKGAFHFAIDHQMPLLPVAIRGSYETLAKLPWWKLHPGREIEVTYCRAIEWPCQSPPAGAGVDELLVETRTAIAAEL